MLRALARWTLPLIAAAAARAAPVVHVADRPLPPVLDGLALPDELLALAVSADGLQAAVALPDPAARGRLRTLVRLHHAGVPDVLALRFDGVVRDVLLHDDGALLLALVHQPARRGEGRSALHAIDLPEGARRRQMPLPASARALAPWADRSAVLVASRDDLRTVVLPQLRSGPLYRIPGENLALAVISGARVAIGQATALLVVDLDDPPLREQMPERARVPAPAPPTTVAVSRDARRGLVRVADGRVLGFDVERLGLQELQPGIVARQSPIQPSAAQAAARACAPAAAGPAAAPAAVAVPSAPPGSPRVPAAEAPAPAPAEPAPAASAPATAPRPGETSGPRSVEPTPVPPARPSVPGGGRIEGDASVVVAVVFLGPDSLLREAARVAPAADGSFRLPDLAPGRYRVQLDGGGARALTTEPPFVLLDVRPGVTPLAPRLRIVRAW